MLMENKILLLKLIDEYRNSIINDSDYVLSMSVLQKVDLFVCENESGELSLDFNAIGSITEEELNVFSLDSIRIIAALMTLSSKSGWRIETVKRLIEKLEQDIRSNKTDKVLREKNSFDKLYNIIDNEQYLDNYMLIFEFINASVETGILSLNDAIQLNFYILRECSANGRTYNDLDVELAEVKNHDDFSQMKYFLNSIFIENGYEYSQSKLRDLEDKFIKYVDFDYVHYVLSMFKKYNVSNKDFYVRLRAFYFIILDNNKENFDSILKFVDENNCNLVTLLSIPSIFSKKKRRYRERSKTGNGTSYYERDLFEIYGVQQDFFDNIELYKKLTGTSSFENSQLTGLSKFLCTPSELVNKNLQLLRLYKIVECDKFPKSCVSLCGTSTEYLIDRYIETSLYDDYLAIKYNNGELKEPRGTSYLDRDNNPFRFYKLKLANSLNQNVFAPNKGIRKIFYDDDMEYMGLSLHVDSNGHEYINQEAIATDKVLPKAYFKEVDYNEKDSFDFFYRYKIVSPVEIFNDKDNFSSGLSGERINGVFLKDYKNVLTIDDIKKIESDEIISILDNGVCLDETDNYRKIKANDFKYEFMHNSVPGVKVVISRYKVLRLCKLLKEDGFWNNESFNDDILNTILCVLLKDSIVSEAEVLVLKTNLKEIFINTLIVGKIRKKV